LNKQKISNLLGLAQRAGKLISGEELVIKAIQEEKAKLANYLLYRGFEPDLVYSKIDELYEE